ncbi:MAG TPA: LuxR C-terminal-related transcriptional regulator, partial [Clostridia bacterium]|nr:LuxR C-terminal-related transcriptional regulator [Clostridia bacterium]
MYRKADRQKVYYFSDKLKRQLARIPHYPLTIVEAPSGFGKTTAVREYLKANLPRDAREYCYTCLGEPASIAWRGICELLANVNGKIAANLKKLEMPTMDTLMYMTAILRDFRCTAETYLVIDNYQLVNCDIPRELMSIFSMHGNPKLHMIFITQQLGIRQQITVHSTDIHAIDSSAFFFDREGTAGLFRMEGIRLSGDELENVFASTEGWVSAIRLQIINFKENGSFDHTADIEHLVETAIWNRLTPEEKDFLLSVSVMDSFTVRQAAIMLNREVLPENIEELLKVRDFDAILSMPFDGQYLGNQKEKNLLGFVMTVVNECPEETLCKYPFVLLVFAYPMLIGGQIEAFQKLCRLIGSVIEKDTGFSREELRRLKGEFALLTSFTGYNDIRKMSEGRRSAWEILGGPSSIIVNDMPWTFGGTSVLSMFWRESGKLEDALRDMDECLPYYLKLTRGHGAGANSVMRAEAMLMRGEDDKAEILCHKALYDARSCQQISICLCAELVLARIAILRGDAEGYFTAVKNIQGCAKENSNLYILRMVELCLSVISLVLGITDNVAEWLYDMGSIKKTLYAPAVPYAQTLYSMLLLAEKRYNEFFGISQLIMDTAGETTGNIRYMMPRVYHLKYLAVAKLNSGNGREAQEYFNQALAIALPDRIYLPFAQQGNKLEPLIEPAKSFAGDRAGLSALAALCKRQEKGAEVIKKAILPAKSPLTPREREIAQLARNRLSAREIAGRLYISEATVRTILRNI